LARIPNCGYAAKPELRLVEEESKRSAGLLKYPYLAQLSNKWFKTDDSAIVRRSNLDVAVVDVAINFYINSGRFYVDNSLLPFATCRHKRGKANGKGDQRLSGTVFEHGSASLN